MPGRNDPCPCGSGKKYKKCCSANVSPIAKMSYSDYCNNIFQSNKFLSLPDYFTQMNKTVSKLYNSMSHIRDQLTKFTKEALDQLLVPEHALVLGPGLCNDIPLKFLTEQFNIVTLVDIDIESVKIAVAKLPEHLQGKCKILQADVSGLDKLFSLITKLRNTANTQEIETTIDSFTEEYKNLIINPKEYGLGSYDLVISSCVSTQLVSPYFRNVIGKHLNENIHKRIISLAHQAALKHCQLLRTCCKGTGYCILTSDVFEWGYRGNQPIALANAIPKLPFSLTIHDVISYWSKYSDYRIVGSGAIVESYKYFKPIVTRAWIWEIEKKQITERLYLVIGVLLQPKALT